MAPPVPHPLGRAPPIPRAPWPPAHPHIYTSRPLDRTPSRHPIAQRAPQVWVVSKVNTLHRVSKRGVALFVNSSNGAIAAVDEARATTRLEYIDASKGRTHAHPKSQP